MGRHSWKLTLSVLFFWHLAPAHSQSISDVVAAARTGTYCSMDDALASGIRLAAQIMRADYGKGRLPDGWRKLESESLLTGDIFGFGRLSINVYQRGDQTIAAIRGAEFRGEYITEGAVWFSGVPSSAHHAAVQHLAQLKFKYPGLTGTGLSKGAGIVNYIANALQIPGIAFNPSSTNTYLSPSGENTPVLNVIAKNDILQRARKIVAPTVREQNMELEINTNCSGPQLCHDVDQFADITSEQIKKGGVEWRGIKCPPKITDPNVMLLCNPLDATMDMVAGNAKLQYTNECNWGVPDKSYSGGFRGERTSIVRCTGWNGIQVLATVEGIPSTARGYGGQKVDRDPTTGKSQVVDVYRGIQFKTACQPPAANSNASKDGCITVGPLRIGNC